MSTSVDLLSSLGNIYGVQIYGNSNNVNISQMATNNLNAGLIYGDILVTDPFKLSHRNFYYSNYSPSDCHGINVNKTCTNINIDYPTITGVNITSPAEDHAKLIEVSKCNVFFFSKIWL